MNPNFLKAEDIECSSFLGLAGQILHRIHKSSRARGIAVVEVATDDRSGPPANSRENRDVLLVIRASIGHRLTDNSRGRFILPKLVPAPSVNRFEPSLHRSIKGHIASGHERSTPDREILFDRPDFFSFHWIPGREFSSVAARTRVILGFDSDVWRSRDIICLGN